MADHIDTRHDDDLTDDEFAQRIEREREDGIERPSGRMDYTGLRADRAIALDSVIDEAAATRGSIPLWTAVSDLLVDRRARGIIDGDDHRAIEAWIDGIGQRPVSSPTRRAILAAADLDAGNLRRLPSGEYVDLTDRGDPAAVLLRLVEWSTGRRDLTELAEIVDAAAEIVTVTA